MLDRALITVGAMGAIVAMICCAPPLLTDALVTAGLAAGLADRAYLLIPALLISLGLIVGLGPFLRRLRRRGPATSEQVRKS